MPIVPFSLTGLVAGAARVPVWRFTWTTAVGYVPITAYFIYLGSKLEGFSLEDPILWIGADRPASGAVRDPTPPLRRGRRGCRQAEAGALDGVGRQGLERRQAIGELVQLGLALGDQALGGG